ncbi:alpha/beta fold hydrolase [Thermomonospora umbrina]|uniref:Alpha-beta hydrolase superfamily lysophospholipase n=1 Tax=Thermomonospora umbrina TaxID=111806 RepID=A0A3D9SHI9_9ACTN|nr:alpha/beta hydrolase [Thermomonospora umbrina]REE95369.1 alpha-beta hydrolase superfamily lysophospholipase [Thermomonospora umbrina]
MPEITARGVRFHVQTVGPAEPAGDAPIVVFLHGLVTDNLSSFYYTLAGPMALAGARCVLYDLRGHGLSERPATGYGVADGVADLFALLDALGHRGPVHLVANSFGGAVALNAALTRPDRVAGLVLIEAYGPAVHAGEWNEDVLNTLGKSALSLEYERTADRLLEIGRRRQGRQAALADALINGTSLLDDLAAADPVRPGDLARVACPVLAVYGEHSEVAPAGRLLRRHVPDCVLHVMTGHAHTVLTEGTEALLQVTLSWLSRRAGGLHVPARAAS